MHQLIAEVVHRGMEQFLCFNEGYPMDIDFNFRSAWLQWFAEVLNSYVLMKDISILFL
jgi:hypothetical protein